MSPDPGQGEREELELAKAIVSGSVEAWHEFLELHSGLLYSVIRRHLIAEDEDDIRSLFVDVLHRLYTGALSNYSGKATLSSWLILFTRRRSVDFLRAKYGRQRPPRGLAALNDFDRLVFQLYYAERMSLEVVAHTLIWQGYSFDSEDIVESLLRIEEKVDRRFLDRLDQRSARGMNGSRAAKVLRFLSGLRVEYERGAQGGSPDQGLLDSEARELIERVKSLVAALPDKDRKVVELRFERGMRAKQIASEMNLPDERKAYTIIDRVVRRLRSALLD